MQAQSRFGTYERHTIERARRPHTRLWIRLLAVALALAAAMPLLGRLHRDAMKLELGPESLAVTAPDRTVTSVAYDDIRGVSLYTNPDYGTCAHGQQQSGCWFGTWRNGQWQTYRLCVHPNVKTCVTVETIDGVFAFNAPSDSDTFKLKSSLDGLLAERSDY